MNDSGQVPVLSQWPAEERPRERLREKGPAVLSDAEVIACLLRTGARGRDAVGLAREMVARFGGLRGLLKAEWQDLESIKGMGPAKVTALLAATELARRQLREKMIGSHFVREPEDIRDYLTFSMRDRAREIFRVLFLNKANRILSERVLFEGTVDETAVYPREILKAALDCGATALVAVHNHPSGRLEPSREDFALTGKLQDLCTAASMKLLDHLIVGEEGFFSFHEQGLLSGND